jgi:hypothetical protein
MPIRSAIFALCCASVASAGDPCTFDSAQRIGSPGYDVGFGVDLNEGGERIVGGAFSSTATFAPGVTRSVAGLEDLFIAKYASDGSLVFVTTTGANDLEGVNDLKFTPDGGAVACGYFIGTVPFGSDVLIASGLDAWVAKVSPTGQFEWARRAGSSGLEEARGIGLDASGNVFVAGYFNNVATFAPGVTLTSAGNADIYLAKYDPNGTLLWAVRAGGNAFDSAEGLAVDANGDALVVGRFQSTATFGGAGAVSSNGSSDVFVAKFSGVDGAAQWVRAAGSTGVDRGVGVGSDSTGDVYITGFFRNTIDFSGTVLAAQNNDDMFLVEYDAAGALLWAQNAGTSLNFVQGLALDSNERGDVAISGYFGGTTTFGDAAFGPTTQLVSAGSFDAFVATFDRDGSLRCAIRGGGGGFSADYGFGVAINEAGAVAATGEFSGAATFGDFNLNAAAQDVWLATLPAPDASVPGDLNGDGVVNFADLNLVLSNFGTSGAPGMTAGDANGDGVVDFSDLNIVLSNFGAAN